MSMCELSIATNGQGDFVKGIVPRESCERLGRSHAPKLRECECDSHRVLRESRELGED